MAERRRTKIRTKTGQRKVKKVLGEFKKGALRSSSGRKITSRKQAIAIGLSEGRVVEKRGRRIAPKRRKTSSRRKRIRKA